jgi:hypothetical protein
MDRHMARWESLPAGPLFPKCLKQLKQESREVGRALKRSNPRVTASTEHVAQQGNDLWITYGDDVIVLANSDVNDLNANYILFG